MRELRRFPRFILHLPKYERNENLGLGIPHLPNKNTFSVMYPLFIVNIPPYFQKLLPTFGDLSPTWKTEEYPWYVQVEILEQN